MAQGCSDDCGLGLRQRGRQGWQDRGRNSMVRPVETRRADSSDQQRDKHIGPRVSNGEWKRDSYAERTPRALPRSLCRVGVHSGDNKNKRANRKLETNHAKNGATRWP
eukprot:Gb_07051 [translate_table: standard]